MWKNYKSPNLTNFIKYETPGEESRRSPELLLRNFRTSKATLNDARPRDAGVMDPSEQAASGPRTMP